MSGSVTAVRVTPTPEELARQEAERRRRERLRAAAAKSAPATVAAAKALERAAGTARSHEHGTRPTARRLEPAGHRETAEPSTVLTLAAILAQEAVEHGVAEIAELALAATTQSELDALAAELDDAIVAAELVQLINEQLDRAEQAVLGEGWTRQGTFKRRSARGDVVDREVAVLATGEVEVRVSVDARSGAINGRAIDTCAKENQIARELLSDLSAAGVGHVSEPVVLDPGERGAARKVRSSKDESEDARAWREAHR